MPSSRSEAPFAHRFVVRALVAVWAACLLAACSASKEVDVRSATADRWSVSDTKAVVDNLIKDMLQGPRSQWLQRWKKNHEGSPTMLVGLIHTQTIRNVDENLVRRDLKKSIVERSTGTDDSLQVIAEKDFLCELRREAEQTSRCGRSTGPTAAEMARRKGADFMLVGRISISSNEVERRRQHGDPPNRPESYSLSLGLTSLEASSSTGWHNEKEIETIVYWLESSPRSPEDNDPCRAVAGMSLRC